MNTKNNSTATKFGIAFMILSWALMFFVAFMASESVGLALFALCYLVISVFVLAYLHDKKFVFYLSFNAFSFILCFVLQGGEFGRSGYWSIMFFFVLPIFTPLFVLGNVLYSKQARNFAWVFLGLVVLLYALAFSDTLRLIRVN